MQRYFCYFFFLFSILSFSLHAQNADVGLGQWRVHLPYNLGKSVAEDGNKVYCASASGLFSYRKDDGSLKRISRIDGLSDFSIRLIRYSTATGVLVIAYENSNIDLLYNDGHIVNLSDIKRKNINGNSSINDIYFKDRFAYLSCGFGIVIINLDKQEIKDTYSIGPNGSSMNVNSLASDDSYFYAATDSGIYKALINDPLIYFYSSWSPDQTLPYPQGKYKTICFFNNKIFTVARDSVVLKHDNSGWSTFNFPNYSSMRLYSYNNYLVIRNYFSVSGFDVNENRIYYVDQGRYADGQPVEAIIDASKVMYIADGNNGLVKDASDNFTIIYPNGPYNIACIAMSSINDDVWVATGAIASISSGTEAYSRNGIYHYSDNHWTSFNNHNTDFFKTGIGNTYPDNMDIKADPSNSKHVYYAGYGAGLVEFNDKGFVNIYDTSNSPLRYVAAGFHSIRVSGLDFDRDNNLWVLNSKPTGGSPIHVKLKDGTWKSFFPKDPNVQFPYDQSFLANMVVDDNDYKWFIIHGTGLGVFYQNDIDNTNDDYFRILTPGAGLGNLPTAQILSMVKDKDNTIWIGTENGVAAFYSPQSVFDRSSGSDAQQVLIQQGSHTQILLQSQNVTAIAVDGANRKWFGTSTGGVYLTSSDGTNQVLHFDIDNSPLLSNNITAIAIDQATGEVFIGTDKGICSYRGSATEGGDVCDNYYVFPNPVKHEYGGLIAVRGLMTNAHVKITDISGNLFYETVASGGQATWSGNNYRGERAHTGVYLVYVSNDDGSATCVTKFLMVN